MTRLIEDARLISIERVDHARSVLIDSHSLRAFDLEAFEDPRRVNAIAPRDLVSLPGGPWLSHVIQTLVLHDTLLVDSVLLEVDQQVCRAHEMFPDAVRGLFIKDSTRRSVGDRVAASAGKIFDRPAELPLEVWNRWQNLDSSEKPLLDTLSEHPPRLIPPEYASDKDLALRLDRDRPIWLGFPIVALASSLTVGRAHFYLELAREFNVPLCIDPVRATYLRLVVEEAFANLTPEKVVAEFAANFDIRPGDSLISFDLKIPAVPEYVLRVAKTRGISLRDATTEARQSRNAKLFRKWCADLVALGSEGGLRARSEYQKVIRDFKVACEAWTKDTGELIEYKTRSLKLSDIPLAGKLLAAAGMGSVTVKDPVLVPERKYRSFLFLNDLLRDPDF